MQARAATTPTPREPLAVPDAGPERHDERAQLDAIAARFSSHEGFNARLVDFRFETLEPWLAGAERVLELGCADGRMTERLARCVRHVTAVDGSSEQVRRLRARLPAVEVVHALFEEYVPSRRFERVVLAHVLEHVRDPVGLLRRAASFAEPGGLLLITVPNADSLHRQAGVAMGLIGAVTDLDEQDRRIGHRRVYTRTTLLADVAASGLAIEHVGGVFLKPLPNSAIERYWSDELIRAYFELGRRYPEIAAEIVVVARVPQATETGTPEPGAAEA